MHRPAHPPSTPAGLDWLNAEWGDFGGEMLNEKHYTVADLAPLAKRKFIYEYDFGDSYSWEHEIRVEEVSPPGSAFKHPCLCPFLFQVKMAAPQG